MIVRHPLRQINTPDLIPLPDSHGDSRDADWPGARGLRRGRRPHAGSHGLRVTPLVDGGCAYPGPAVAFAAVNIRSCVSSGWETIAQCPLATSIVSAPIRLANCLSASGGITSSFSATRYHEGSDFHAGVPITSSNVDTFRGCWTANMTLALTGSISAAKGPRRLCP